MITRVQHLLNIYDKIPWEPTEKPRMWRVQRRRPEGMGVHLVNNTEAVITPVVVYTHGI